MKVNNRIGFRFSRSTAWQFFLIVAFPIHLWALLLWFLDFETVAQRTNQWDAIGEGGYFLCYAFFESLVVYGILFILLLLLPKRLDQKKVFIIVATVYFVVAGWFMLEQGRFLPFIPEENWLVIRLRTANSLRSNTGKMLAIGFAASVFVPGYLVIKSHKLRAVLSSLYERIITLSLLYLFLDLAGFVIVLLRIR
jgi:hypothetical protein